MQDARRVLAPLGNTGRLACPDRPRYTHTTTFATYPFPDGMSPADDVASARQRPAAAAIELAARRLDELRNGWLNPPDLVERVPEMVENFPDRIVPRNEKAAATLRKRTLTALYNTRGTPEGAWLDALHRALDEAVAAAYGWPADLAEDEVLARLLELNLARAAAEKG
ncbi:MAG: hypothetical protein IT556_14540 [Acetobacteraceae bacterium]|nr:hypothetical protein [Acetobacteraceae bacterium]